MESEGPSAGVVGEYLSKLIISLDMPCCMYCVYCMFVSCAANPSENGEVGSLWARTHGSVVFLDGFRHISGKGGWGNRIRLNF